MKGDTYASELSQVVTIDYNEHNPISPPLFMPRFLVKYRERRRNAIKVGGYTTSPLPPSPTDLLADTLVWVAMSPIYCKITGSLIDRHSSGCSQSTFTKTNNISPSLVLLTLLLSPYALGYKLCDIHFE
jgi:hypothetical protein